MLRRCMCKITHLILLLACCGCFWQGTLLAQSRPTPTSGPVDRGRVSSAIDAAAEYLVRACGDDGRFAYRVALDPNALLPSDYNLLRHAGAIYALAQYVDRQPHDDARQVLMRAGTYLKGTIQPVAGNRHMTAVWTVAETTGIDAPRQAKLGGAGLGLVALLSIEKIEPGFTSLDELRRLGRFLLYMQKPDGSFYSKYYPDRGRDDRWTSMYYPGEAALALLMLYEADPKRQWLGGASKALAALARSGSQRPKTLPDQWVLLATARITPYFETDALLVSRRELLDHARRTCRDMLEDQQGQLASPSIRGCYTHDGRTCPTATRLEGLLAALQFLPREEQSFRQQIRHSIDDGIRFLLDNQVKEGPYAGGLTRVALGFSGSEREDAAVDSHPTEIRIDFVQHALSAMLAYERELRSVDER